ncbi:MAG: hypothetical protein VB075_00455 [Petrimonas sp.]|uniref:hypothetical protein n=1 Tax=Petrimonas sp. TaxID=2023866 RepID=UPI002B3645EF|nr:hypothetical protein [Petrimonas sp.]
MKLKGDIFDSRATKKLFLSEGYTQEEWRELMKSGSMLRSRKYERMAYILQGGKINIINLR